MTHPRDAALVRAGLISAVRLLVVVALVTVLIAARGDVPRPVPRPKENVFGRGRADRFGHGRGTGSLAQEVTQGRPGPGEPAQYDRSGVPPVERALALRWRAEHVTLLDNEAVENGHGRSPVASPHRAETITITSVPGHQECGTRRLVRFGVQNALVAPFAHDTSAPNTENGEDGP